MITVNVATLKEKLNHYLGLVREGQEVLVTSHRYRVARILPASASDAQVTKPTLLKGTGKLQLILGQIVSWGVSWSRVQHHAHDQANGLRILS